MMSRFQVVWPEDQTPTVLGRLTAADGSGSATGVNGEGNWLQQADISTITCAVYDLDSATPETAIVSPTVTISSAVLDTPVTTNVLWTKDSTGYNFKFELPVTAFPTGDHTYCVQFTVTSTGGTVMITEYVGPACPVHAG